MPSRVKTYVSLPYEVYELLKEKARKLKKKHTSDLIEELIVEAVERRGWR